MTYNHGRASISQPIETTLEDAMEAFDNLPPVFREMLRNGSVPVSPIGMARQLEKLPWMLEDPEAVKISMDDFCRKDYFWQWVVDGLDNPRFFKV